MINVVIKATRKKKETSSYVRKVRCVFLVKEDMRNGNAFLLREKKVILS